jgi:hypothetical protein
MAIHGKYTPEQRKIVTKILQIKHKQRYHRNRWLDLDVKLSVLENLLNEEKY